MNKLLVNSLLLFTLSLFTALCPAYALELIIEDASGNIRHVADVQGKANVRLTVTNLSGQPVEGANITISLQDAQNNTALKQADKVRQSKVVVGLAEFKDVTPGRWVLSADSDSLVLASIDVLDPSAMMAQPGGEETISLLGIEMPLEVGVGIQLVGGALVVGGVGAGIYALTEDDSNNNEPSPFE